MGGVRRELSGKKGQGFGLSFETLNHFVASATEFCLKFLTFGQQILAIRETHQLHSEIKYKSRKCGENDLLSLGRKTRIKSVKFTS
jgi:hypothetical protein